MLEPPDVKRGEVAEQPATSMEETRRKRRRIVRNGRSSGPPHRNARAIPDRKWPASLPKIRPELFASGSMAEPPDGFLLDLPHALARELKFLADLFERQRVLAAETEVEADHLRFALRERPERALDLLAERLLDQRVVGQRGDRKSTRRN